MNTEFKKIGDMTGPELVEEFNRIAVVIGKTEVKRFADRATGIKRVRDARELEQDFDLAACGQLTAEEQRLMDSFGHIHCPECGIPLDNGVGHDGDEVNGKVVRLDREFECLACGHQFGRPTKGEVNELRSAGVAESWKDEDVRKARATRNGVKVDGEEFRSVKAAFIALGLPLSKHIRFRMELKAAKTLISEDRKWELV